MPASFHKYRSHVWFGLCIGKTENYPNASVGVYCIIWYCWARNGKKIESSVPHEIGAHGYDHLYYYWNVYGQRYSSRLLSRWMPYSYYIFCRVQFFSQWEMDKGREVFRQADVFLQIAAQSGVVPKAQEPKEVGCNIRVWLKIECSMRICTFV